MNVGVFKAKFKKSELSKAISWYREKAIPAVAAHKGGRGAMLLTDPATGEVISIGIYEDEAAAKAFNPKFEQLSDELKQFVDGPAPKRQLFEMSASLALENKALAEKAVKAFNEGDLEQIARMTAPDATYKAPGGVELRGPQQVKEYFKTWRKAFPDAQITVEKIVVQGHNVATQGTFTGTHSGPFTTPGGEIAPTGKKVSGAYAEVAVIDRGLVVSDQLYYDQVQLLQQLGLMPAQQPAKRTS
ncbi:MAG TPA: ester cyclase [Candidatus Acidoferrales bacterium]|nr:ester cyclase [Candidatus Acidoferrales bacterium]